jgi:hypothetical protein
VSDGTVYFLLASPEMRDLLERQIYQVVGGLALARVKTPERGTNESILREEGGADSVCGGDAAEVRSEATSGWTRR